MWIERNTLAQEIPAVSGLDTRQLCEMLASLGFPVDEVATREGSEVLDVDITANRGDAMSHRGIAREVAAKLHQPLVAIDAPPVVEGKPVVEVRLELSHGGRRSDEPAIAARARRILGRQASRKA